MNRIFIVEIENLILLNQTSNNWVIVIKVCYVYTRNGQLSKILSVN